MCPGHAQIRNHCSEILALQSCQSLTAIENPFGLIPMGAQVPADLLTHLPVVCHD
jgi:hypothetical protein